MCVIFTSSGLENELGSFGERLSFSCDMMIPVTARNFRRLLAKNES